MFMLTIICNTWMIQVCIYWWGVYTHDDEEAQGVELN